MRFFKSFRILHRRTKSEGDVISALSAPSQSAIISDETFPGGSFGTESINFSPLNINLPFFDPADLYATSLTKPSRLAGNRAKPHTFDPETELAVERNANHALKADLEEITTQAMDSRNALYAELTANAYHKRQMMLDSEHIQRLKNELGRYEAIHGFLADCGLAKDVLDSALATTVAGGNGEDVLFAAICTKSNASNPIAGYRSAEQYAAVVNMTLSTRQELKKRNKITKFWKRAAQKDGQHLNTITPSPSDISSIHEALSPERKKAVDDLILRRRKTSQYTPTTSRTLLSADEEIVKNQKATPTRKSHGTLSSVLVPAIGSTSPLHRATSTLSPLASDSIKQELARHSTSTRFSERQSNKRVPQISVLQRVDLNLPAVTNTLKPTPHAQVLIAKRTAPLTQVVKPHRRYPSSASESDSGRITKKGRGSDSTYSTKSFVSALSASLRKSASSRRTKGNSRASSHDPVHSRQGSGNVRYSIPLDNSAFCDPMDDASGFVTISVQGSMPQNQVLTSQPPFEYGASLGHISEESTSFQDQLDDTTFETQATPTTGQTTASGTPTTPLRSKLPIFNYARQFSPLSINSPNSARSASVTPSPKVDKISRVRSSSSPTPKHRSAIPVSIRPRDGRMPST